MLVLCIKLGILLVTNYRLPSWRNVRWDGDGRLNFAWVFLLDNQRGKLFQQPRAFLSQFTFLWPIGYRKKGSGRLPSSPSKCLWVTGGQVVTGHMPDFWDWPKLIYNRQFLFLPKTITQKYMSVTFLMRFFFMSQSGQCFHVGRISEIHP